MSWSDFLAFLNSPVIADDKNGLEGWSPAKFRGNRRGKANVEAVSCLVLDDDANALPLSRLVNIYHGAAGAVHSSHSSTAEHPKWRIILRLSRDVNAEEYDRLWAHVRKRVTDGGYLLDEATKDASRLWYVPAHKSGGVYEWRELQGEPVPVDEILASYMEDKESSSGAEARNQPALANSETLIRPPDAGLNRRKAMAAALGAAWPAKGRHEAQLALAGALRSEGWAEAEALEFLCDVTRAAGDEDRPKREATIRHTYGQPAGAPLTGWTRLKAKVDPVTVDAVRGALGKDADLAERIRLIDAAKAEPLVIPAAGDITAGPFVFRVGGFDAELPPLTYQIEKLICKGDVCMLVAHGNSLKTWLAFSLALAVANGRPWLGKFLAMRGRVGIIDFESGEYEIKRRMKILGAKDAEIEARLLYNSYSGAALTDAENWIALAPLDLDMLIIDSFNAASPETDENDARAAVMLQRAGAFANATGCTVIVIHHARKGNGGDARESVRGSTAIYAACDRVFKFDEPEKKNGGRVLSTVRSVKDGAGPAPAPVRVELSDQGLALVEAAKEIEEDDEKPSPARNRERAIAMLRAHPAGIAQDHLINIMKGRRENKFALLSEMVLAGLLVEYRDSAEKKTFIMLKPGAEP